VEIARAVKNYPGKRRHLGRNLRIPLPLGVDCRRPFSMHVAANPRQKSLTHPDDISVPPHSVFRFDGEFCLRLPALSMPRNVSIDEWSPCRNELCGPIPDEFCRLCLAHPRPSSYASATHLRSKKSKLKGELRMKGLFVFAFSGGTRNKSLTFGQVIFAKTT